MEVRKRTISSITVLKLSGDLDGRSAQAAQEKILPLLPPRERVLLDLTGVPYMSSAGLRTLLLIYRQAQCLETTVGLVGLSAELRTVLSATGFLGFFVVADNINAGIEALRDGARKRSGVV
jgi:anti-sigma B factor antagonist